MLDRDKYLSELEAKQLRKYSEAMALLDLEKGRSFYIRAWAVIDFLLGTGCRASEVRMVKIGHLSLRKEPCVTVTGKGNKKRTIDISNDLKKHLKHFIAWKRLLNEGIDSDDYLFTNRLGKYWTLMGIQNLFKKMAKEAGLRPVYSIHSTRHAFGFMTFKKSKNIRLVQNLLGHSSLGSTQIYTHVDPEEIKTTVNNLWQ